MNDFLNKTTMYKVVEFGLFAIAFHGIGMSALGILPFDALIMVFTLIFLVFSCYFLNILIARFLGIITNFESSVITSLILFLIIEPASKPLDFFALFLISLVAIASKYILIINKIHIFNPAACAAILSGLVLNYYATWWVGSAAMLPVVLIVGIFVVKKVHRFALVSIFLLSAILSALIFNFSQDLDFLNFISQFVTSWPLIFFATFMLTEPLTMPGTKKLQLFYAFIVGILFGAKFNIGPVYSTPELALVLGNLGFFILHPRNKFVLTLKEKQNLSADIVEFKFIPDRKVNFIPGQYIEWTINQFFPDFRGNRRFFTLASSPTENDVEIGVRFNKDSSSFKKKLHNMNLGEKIYAAQISGDFTLDQTMPAVFISGGIGITPFRSIIKSLIDIKQNHDISLFYFARAESDFVYRDLFTTAEKENGIKVFYIVSDSKTNLEKLIMDKIPDFHSKKYYLSGPSAMVDNYKKVIRKLGIGRRQIVTDYFPGF